MTGRSSSFHAIPLVAAMFGVLTTAAVAEHWAFQAPRAGQLPEARQMEWVRGDIDRFVLARLEAQGLRPAADADPRALIRRASFDLTGLPPTPEEVEAYVEDGSADAFEKVVDRLLASPRFGERWGRHWLDVARFAESVGGGRTKIFDHAWRYRDYVIDTFNADKPYDRFITEQVAGDLLPYVSLEEGGEQLVATTFLTLGPKNLDDQDKEQLDLDIADEQLDTLGQSVLGLTIGCARCHDHKFDPISQRDYTAMLGIFTSTKGVNHANVSEYLEIDLPISGDRRRELDAHAAAVASLELQTQAGETLRKEVETRPAAVDDGGARGRELRAITEHLAVLESSVKGLRARAPAAAPRAMAPRDADKPADCRLRIRGETHHYGPSVPRGFLSTVQLADSPTVITGSGRPELARWITARDHPLTARVMVNRIWAHLIGQGLVRSLDNFGARGEPPTHPELLDHLALRFIAEGWSVKGTVRRVVLSRVYRMGTAHDTAAFAVDPENRLLWRAHRRRLDAESLRDAMLVLGGELDLTMGGSSIVRPVDSEFGYHLRHDSPRRSVYLPVFRNSLPAVFEVFDFADPNLVCGRRNVGTLATQSLYLMNSEAVMDSSKRMAERLLSMRLGDAERIDLAYRLTLSRPPKAGERKASLVFLSEQAAAGLEPLEAWGDFCQALFACIAFRYPD